MATCGSIKAGFEAYSAPKYVLGCTALYVPCYGFRPGRSAHEVLQKAKQFVAGGRDIVEEIDLENFFDRVNHDVLMNRLSRHVGDKRMLKIIGRFLRAGMMSEGVCVSREQGTPQGGPLYPLLLNLLLDDLDKELERRGHCFRRYADDCNIYVQSLKAGERVMQSLTRFLEQKLRLRVNREKSTVAPVEDRKFLGHRLRPSGHLGIAPQSLNRAKERVRQIAGRSRGVSIDQVIDELNKFLTGWVAYFRYAQCKSQLEKLDSWIRRKLRFLRLTTMPLHASDRQLAAKAGCASSACLAGSPERSRMVAVGRQSQL